MSIAPHTGIVDFGTFTAPTASTDGIQGEVPQPLAGQEGYVLTGTGWASAGSVGLVGYQGTWNALTNTPTLTSSVGVQGYYYVVDVAGTTNLNGITDWQVGDWAIFNGSIWQKVDNTDSYDPANVAITGGTINNTVIGGTTPAAGTFTTLNSTSDANFGTGLANYIQARGASAGNTPYVSSWGSDTNVNLDSYTRGTGSFRFRTASSPTQLQITHTASAVNYVQVTGAATGGRPTISGQGSDANVDLNFAAKGTSGGHLFTANNAIQAVVSPTTSAVNYVQLTGGVTGGNVQISAQGTDASTGISLVSKGGGGSVWKGDGGVYFQNNAANNLFSVENTASTVNRLTATGSVTGSGPRLFAQGSDTNIDLNLTTKGTGGVLINANGIDTVLVKNSIPTILGSTSTTNLSNKYFVIGSRQYTTTEVGTTLIGSENTSTANNVMIGGYYGELNAASNIQFYTAGTVTTRSGTKQFQVSNTSSAVNYVEVTGAATSGAPTISTQGSDTNASLLLRSKGTFACEFQSSAGTILLQALPVASSVNYFRVSPAITGFGPVLSAQGSDTNIPAVVQPKGTGALQAQQTDSTATGGNARGANAVDWQTSRDTAAKVASGQYAVISGGYRNTASGFASVLAGGEGNVSNGFLSTLSGGSASTASGQYSFLGAGYLNTVSGNNAVALGGYGNTSAGFYNLIGGGYTNSGTSASAVTTQSATMNGTTAVTLSGSNASIKVGQLITGTSIANFPHTYVAAISGTSLTLSQAASGSSTSTLSFYTPHGVVVGGGNNQATGSYSFIGGGGDAGTAANRNVASGDWSVVAGGIKNTASGFYSFIGGGGADLGGTSANLATGSTSVIGGGYGNTASAAGSAILGGYSHVANGQKSTVIGGSLGTTRGITANIIFPASNQSISASSGVSQSALLVLGRQTTDATPTVLTSDPNAAGTTNQIILPNNSAYYFKGSVIANVTGAANGAAWSIEGAIMRGANAASTVLIGTVTLNRVAATAGASLWVVAITADTTNGGLAVTVTGLASTTIRWVAKLETTEVTF